MRKTLLYLIIVKKLIDNKPFSVAIKIVSLLVASFLLRFFILPTEFFSIDTTDFIQKYLNNETLSIPQWFSMFWNSNIRQLTWQFIIVIIILLIFRFRFKKADNFRLTRHTAIIALICFLISATGLLFVLHYDVIHDGLTWQSRIADVLYIIFMVALYEEFVYRGFITNELFKLKQDGMKSPTAIAISAVIFGFIHIEPAIYLLLFLGFTHSITNLSTWGQFIFTAGCGVSWAVILYYRKDIISLICIHATINIMDSSYISSGRSVLMGALYVIFFISFVVFYPAFLIYKAKINRKLMSRADNLQGNHG